MQLAIRENSYANAVRRLQATQASMELQNLYLAWRGSNKGGGTGYVTAAAIADAPPLSGEEGQSARRNEFMVLRTGA